MANSEKSKNFEFVVKPLATTDLLVPPRYVIKGIWPLGCMTLLKGLPGQYKTFNAIAMNLCAATGLSFCGRRVLRCKPFYLAADDPDGARMRAQAWVKYHEGPLRQLGIPLDFIDAMMLDRVVNFSKDDEVRRALEDIKRQFKPDVITLDTVFHSTVGANLTQPDEVTPILKRFEESVKELGAHSSMLVHHTPKDGKGFWGSVIIEGWVHAMIHSEVNPKTPDTATLRCERMKGARPFDPIDITLKTYKLKTKPDDEGIDEVEVLVVAGGIPAAKGKTKEEEDLEDMEMNLECFLGNKATFTSWLEQMWKYFKVKEDDKDKKGWSKASFDRKLKKLKDTSRVTGGGNQGDLYSVSNTPEAETARGTTAATPISEPVSAEVVSSKNRSHLSPFIGTETSETGFLGPKAVSKQSHETGETGSRNDGNESKPVVPNDQNDVLATIGAAVQQLKKAEGER